MINIQVLYSWEKNSFLAKEWTMALCLELSSYRGIKAECDMLWEPESDIKASIKSKIEAADRIIIVVTKSYNEKIKQSTGMVSYEESIYKEILKKTEEKNKILFILKDKKIDLPEGWEGYNRVDLSLANIDDYSVHKDSIEKKIDDIILFLSNQPEYKIPISSDKKPIPKSSRVLSFKELFLSESTNMDEGHDKTLRLCDQERILKNYIEKNAEQRSFVDEYIKVGLAGDNNFNDKISPELFLKHFFVERSNDDEQKYKRTITELFGSYTHNMLCLQSDRGSGKTVFLKTIAYRYAEITKNSRYHYNTIIFDFSNINDKSVTKESVIFQKLKKIYRRIMKDSVPGWRNSFVEKLQELEMIEFPTSGLMFNLNDFELELKDAVQLLAPSDNLDDWYYGYSKRVEQIKNKADKNILFILLLTFYLLALESMPDTSIKKDGKTKQNRFVIVFDNIETFDNGEMAKKISDYVQKCHGFIQKIYGELNNKDTFFTTFTFVLSMRTSTFLPFGNQHTNLWSGEKYIKRLKYYDFTIEALIKKIIFLKRIKNYKDSYLFKTLVNVLSIMIPRRTIFESIESDTAILSHEKYFATYRYLPLFNNNYRRAMEMITGALTNDSTCELYLQLLGMLSGRQRVSYDNLISGIRKMIIRHIFDDLFSNGYLSTIGFKGLTGGEESSMTRMILEFLYWSEIRHLANSPATEFEGVEISKLIWVFKHFCTKECLANTLYDLSIYVNRSRERANALYAWAYLIYYRKLDADLSDEEFKRIIYSIFESPNHTIKLHDMRFEPSQIKVKLSDAGMCFVQNYMRDAEFLMARNKDEYKLSALYSLTSTEEIQRYISLLFDIISNCIKKIIIKGEKVCKLYGNNKERCVFEVHRYDFDVMQCSLFIRYQECLDMIRESIDYLDRFRLSYYERKGDNNVNSMILENIKAFYGLYTTVNNYLLECDCKNKIESFIKMWNGSYNTICVERINRCDNKRIDRNRPIQNYYVFNNEKFENAIQKLNNDEPLSSLYRVIEKQIAGESYEEH